MKTWQILGSARMTLGLIEAVTAKAAVAKYRALQGQDEPYYDFVYGIDQIIDNKILLK